MKRIYILLVILLGSASSAYAWSDQAAATIAEIASKHLSEEARNNITAVISTPLLENANFLVKERKEKREMMSSEWHYVEVYNTLYPMLDNDANAITQIENAVAALRNRASLPEAEVRRNILILVNLVSDIHCISNIRIEGFDRTYSGFNFSIWNNRTGKRSRYSKGNWKKLWENSYSSRRSVFSPQDYAGEVMHCFREDLAGFANGTPTDWTMEVAGEAKSLLSEIFTEGVVIRMEEFNRLEMFHERNMARAGSRIAMLLNDIFATK